MNAHFYEYAPLPDHLLPIGTRCARPVGRRRLMSAATPALEVMTDFESIEPRVTSADTTVDRALDAMRDRGVRALLVTTPEETVIGLISAYDIQGEHPVTLAETLGIPRAEVRVGQVMLRREQIPAIEYATLDHATVGHVVATLRNAARRHVLVVESGEANRVRGMFSAAEVGRRLGVDIADVMRPAHSLAEIVSDLA